MRYFIVFMFVVIQIGCNLENDIDIDLPEYTPRVVVEAYIQSGKPLTALLTWSTPFFEPFDISTLEVALQKALVQNAEINIRYGDETIKLNNVSYLEEGGRFANYYSFHTIDRSFSGDITLSVILENGETINSTTTFLPVIPIDSLVVEFNEDSIARVLTYMTDNQAKVNFYRRTIHGPSLDSIAYQDFLVEDNLSDNGVIAFGTGYDFEVGESVINTIHHISKPYYEYLLSVELSIAANLDPITQPGAIFSNVEGSAHALGIFTALSFDRDTTLIGQ